MRNLQVYYDRHNTSLNEKKAELTKAIRLYENNYITLTEFISKAEKLEIEIHSLHVTYNELHNQ